MKQAKLSFASKRTTSAVNLVKSTKKRPKRASTSPIPVNPIPVVIVSSDSEGHDSDQDRTAPAPKKRRLSLEGSVPQTRSTSTAKQEEDDKVAAAPERESLKLSDPRWLKLYGKARDEMGNIDPVHATGQSMVHHILRVFDLSYQYGPCVGVSRLDRWERAHALGLNPPTEVKDILFTKEGSTDEQFSQSVFHGEV